MPTVIDPDNFSNTMLNSINQAIGRNLRWVIVQWKSIYFCQIMAFLSPNILFVMLQHRGHNHLLDYMAMTSITHSATGLHLPQHLSDHPLINGLMNCTVLWLWSNYNCICLQWRLSLFPFCLGLSKSFFRGGHAQTTELCLTGKGTQIISVHWK